MTEKLIRIGEKFPEEAEMQSMYSPSVVMDEEIVERELRRREEMSETGKPTEAAFPRKQLLGKNGSGLSVNRLCDPEARDEEERVTAFRRVFGRARAIVGKLREITDREGCRTASVVDAGTSDDPRHAEIYMRLQGTVAGTIETRAKVLKAFGGRQRCPLERQLNQDESA